LAFARGQPSLPILKPPRRKAAASRAMVSDRLSGVVKMIRAARGALQSTSHSTAGRCSFGANIGGAISAQLVLTA